MAVDVPVPAELLLARIFEEATVGLGFVDAEGRFVHVNPALAEMNGRSVEDHLGRTVREVLGSDGGAVDGLVREIVVSGSPVLGFEIEDPATGAQFLADYVPVAVDGDVRGVLAIVEDVTARRDADRRGRALIDADVVGVLIAHENEIAEANDAFLAILGWTRDQFEAAGLRWTDITPPEWEEVDAAKLEELRTRGAASAFEKEYVRRDGARVPVLIGAATLRRHPLEVVAFVVDLSEREAALRAEREAREERDRILESIGEGFVAFDRDWRFSYVNPTAEAVLGRPGAALVGRTLGDAFPEARGTDLERRYREAMAGEVRGEFELELALWGRWYAVRVFPAPDGVSALFRDVTEPRELLERERRAADRARRLSALAEGLAAAVNADEVAEVAVEQARAALDADAAALIEVEENRLRWLRHAGYGERAAKWQDRSLDDMPGPLPEAIATGRAVLVPDREEWRRRYGEPGPDVRNVAYAAVPLALRQGAVGGLGLAFAQAREFSSGDEDLLLALGHQVAQALDRARLYEQVAGIAHTLQQGLLPRRLPTLPGAELGVRYRPLGHGAEVGGDFYDVFESGAGEWALAMGDVCGKGTEAAVVTGMARNTIRALALRERNPAAILGFLNGAILRHGGDRFCTVALAKLRADSGGLALALASGGHPPPVVLRADGGLEVVEVRGDLLGLFPDVSHDVGELRLHPGDAVVFYTDGIIDAPGEDGIWGEERLQAQIAAGRGLTADELAERIDNAVRAFHPGEPRDDKALVVLRVLPDARHVETLPITGRRDEPAFARDLVGRAVGSVVPRERVEELQLLTTELISNVLRHAPGARGSLALRCDPGRVRVEVRDEGDGFRPPARAPDATGGWGLLLVERLADRWGITPGSVWFELDVDGQASPSK